VRIKPRAKDHPTDDFKIVVNYTVSLSFEEQENLKKMVPASPMIKRKPDGYTQLEEIPSESIIEDDELDYQPLNPMSLLFKKKNQDVGLPDHKTISVNLLKNFDQILML
jgi:hypothetical protein